MAVNKRSNGEGSYYRSEAGGLWEYRIYYKDVDGIIKRKKFKGKTKGVAKEKADEFLVAKEREIDNAASSNKILSVWIERWLQDYVSIRVKIRSLEKYKSCIKYVLEEFGNRRMDEITVSELQSFFSGLMKHGGVDRQGLSADTVRGVRRYLSTCYNDAIKIGLVQSNPVQNTQAPKATKKEIIVISKEKIDELISAAEKFEPAYTSKMSRVFMRHMLPVLIYTAVYTGMRQGELLGLQWDDLDIEHCSIHVCHSLIHAVKTEGIKKSAILQGTKTASGTRNVAIRSEDMQKLLDYRKWIKEKYVVEYGNDVTKRNFSTSNFVFTSTYGNELSVTNFLSRWFRPLCRQVGISDDFTFHGLRHTHATLLLKIGINPKIVQERLGHSSVKITMDTYSHFLPDMQESVLEAMSKRL